MVIAKSVAQIMAIKGVLSCAIINIETGESIYRAGREIAETLEFAGLVNARLLRSKQRLVEEQFHEHLKGVLFILDRHYHIIRLISCGTDAPAAFLYFVLDKSLANLAITRHKLANIEQETLQTPEAIAALHDACTPLQFGSWSRNGLDSTASQKNVLLPEEELPAFMQEDTVMKLLGIGTNELYFPG